MPAKKITPAVRAQRVLKGALSEQGLTMEKLAKRLGYKDMGSVSRAFADIYNVKLSMIVRICTILRLDVRELLEILERG